MAYQEAKEDICISEKIPLQVEGTFLGLLTMNQPERLNPMGGAMGHRLHELAEELADDDSVRVIAITGSGRAFSAGGDLKEYKSTQRKLGWLPEPHLGGTPASRSYASYRQPVIALINGWCVAGGIEIVMGCDFAYISESAKIGDGHVNYGMVGGGGSQVTLPRVIGRPKAFELLFTGKFLTAQEAFELGLVNKVVPDGKLVDAAVEFANIVAEKSPLGIAKIKQIVWRGLYSMTAEDHGAYEKAIVREYVFSEDAQEGLKAFAEKRKPKFTGR